MTPANMHPAERIVRLILGVLLLGLYGALDAPWKYFTLFGLVLIATALSGFCPIYRLTGISTTRR
jgi:hypothetical protein